MIYVDNFLIPILLSLLSIAIYVTIVLFTALLNPLSVKPLARGESGCLLDTLLLILDTLIYIFLCLMQWDKKVLETQFTANVYIWTPNYEIMAKALLSVKIAVFYSVIKYIDMLYFRC